MLGIFPSSLTHDIANGLLFYQVVGIALTLGFVIAGILRIFIPLRRDFSYGLAGLTSILVMLIGVRIPFYGAALIAGARSSLGFILFLLSRNFFDALIVFFSLLISKRLEVLLLQYW